jgi:exodeoxyribonuclease V alpha subunit
LVSVRQQLDAWVEQGWLRSLDRAFALFLAAEVPAIDPLALLAAALVSYQLGRGHVCLHMGHLVDNPLRTLGLPEEGLKNERAVSLVNTSAATSVDSPANTLAGASMDSPASIPVKSRAHAPANSPTNFPTEHPLPLQQPFNPLSSGTTLVSAPANPQGKGVIDPLECLRTASLARWHQVLASPAFCLPGPGNTPLVLSGDRLYLRRNWQYERTIFHAIHARLLEKTDHSQADLIALRTHIDALFAQDPCPEGQSVHYQKLACAMIATRAFGIITGGPGTGKTTTVLKLLALLQARHIEQASKTKGISSSSPSIPLTIRLAAPTGKAAARLSESINGAIDALDVSALPDAEAIRCSIPREVVTLHRLLGRRPGSRQPAFRRGNPLALDILVVDEASMIDLEMMAAVMEALPEGARLILLGDKDQLASVEAGAVLGELCRHAEAARYHPETAVAMSIASGEQIPESLIDPQGSDLDQAIVMLRHSYRFSGDKGIGRLAEAVNRGAPDEVRRQLRAGHEELLYLETAADRTFETLVLEGRGPDDAVLSRSNQEGDSRKGYRYYLDVLRHSRPEGGAQESDWDAWAYTVLRAHRSFQVLAAVRQGSFGVEGLNAMISAILQRRGLIAWRADGWYEGRPVMITHNDYALGLMNGDVGVALLRPDSSTGEWALRVAFATEKGIKWVSTARLEEVETVFALTVHKSQGSEFGHTLLVLPDTPTPILTRELLYTAITRSKQWLSLVNPGGEALLESCVINRVERASGLLDPEK